MYFDSELRNELEVLKEVMKPMCTVFEWTRNTISFETTKDIEILYGLFDKYLEEWRTAKFLEWE